MLIHAYKKVEYYVSSPTDSIKESCICKLQSLLKENFNESILNLLRRKSEFYNRLQFSCQDKARAKQLLQDVKLYIATSAKNNIRSNYGYIFYENITNIGKADINIVKVSKRDCVYCAKIGPWRDIQKEADIGRRVKGPCVMPVIDTFPLDSSMERGALICPLYQMNTADRIKYLSDHNESQNFAICLLLCGLSAIHSFACQSLCHADIKLTNFMTNGNEKCILIDFGSATPFNSYIQSSTSGMSFAHSAPSIRYDINSLAIATAQVLFKGAHEFSSKKALFESLQMVEKDYPIILEMLKLIKIDTDVGSISEFRLTCQTVYNYAVQMKPFLAECDFLKIQVSDETENYVPASCFVNDLYIFWESTWIMVNCIIDQT